jgi:hypothetical protein
MEEETLRKELDRLFQSYCKTAEGLFYSAERVESLIFILQRKGDQLYFAYAIPVIGDEDELAEIVQHLSATTNAVEGVIVFEAWAPKIGKDGIWDGTPPSKRLDREEILQVALFSKVINRMKIWKIVRKGGKKKYLEPEQGDFLDPIYSRFFGNYFRVDA